MKIEFIHTNLLKESLLIAIVIITFSIITAIFVGFRLEHLLIIILFCSLFFAGKESRKLAVGIIPFIIFGISY
ncbi:MAG: inositol phosphorylceramide synthase, partial [Bacteroidales bacterium]|nr:inositol phosphorylceramide synthase [Bacteroidales bacterium]